MCNLTTHSYFNLSGKGEILNHRLMVPADRITAVDQDMIPTGTLKSVAGTPLDFRKPTAIGAVIQAEEGQLKIAGGFDHNWVFNKKPGELTLLARVEDPSSGRILEVFSTEPGLQVYTADFGDGCRGKGGQVYRHRASICLEPQHYPDSPNHPQFPTVVLRPGETYRNTTIYRFSEVNR
jgi:aldose 1-epimerase